MEKKNCHVSKHPEGGWQYKKEGAYRAAGIVDTQKEAERAAKRNWVILFQSSILRYIRQNPL